MSKLLLDSPVPMPAGNLSQYPLVDRFTLSTIPSPGTVGKAKCVLVTDGTFGVNAGQGQPYVGGGSLLNLVWNNGGSWITC